MQNKKWFVLYAPSLILCGCSRSPSVNVLGSYFPAWIMCCLIGIILAVATHFILVRIKVEAAIPLKTLVYPCAAAAYTFLAWIIFYS